MITLTIRMPKELHETMRIISFHSRISINQIMLWLIADNIYEWEPYFAHKEDRENFKKFMKSKEYRNLLLKMKNVWMHVGGKQWEETLKKEKIKHLINPED